MADNIMHCIYHLVSLHSANVLSRLLTNVI